MRCHKPLFTVIDCIKVTGLHRLYVSYVQECIKFTECYLVDNVKDQETPVRQKIVDLILRSRTLRRLNKDPFC